MHCFDHGHLGKQPVAWKEYCGEYWLKELQESMGRCTGRHFVTEILLKRVLNTIQSINYLTKMCPAVTEKYSGQNIHEGAITPLKILQLPVKLD